MSCAQTEEVPALEWESDTNFLLETFQLPLLPKEQRETVARWMTWVYECSNALLHILRKYGDLNLG